MVAYVTAPDLPGARLCNVPSTESTMRMLITVVSFSLGASTSFAQAAAGSPPPPAASAPHGSTPPSTNADPMSRDTAFARCLHMWDSGTHMTKQEWWRTCERVQARFDNLDATTTMSISQSTSQKTGNRKEQAPGHQSHADVMYTMPAICAPLPTVARPITPECRDPWGPSSVWR
jgi:hypothetical protein